ncbi:MAG: hypothetical protein ACK4HR_02075 [Hyphomonas sp.]|jgi:hypothetical protein
MTPMRALRANPHFASLFAHVHPLCWPILWWSLNRLIRWYVRSGYAEVLYETSPWGFIRIAYYGDRKPDPSAYRPYVLEKPRWDNPVWRTNAPTRLLDIAACETLRLHPHPPSRSGGGCEGLAIALQSPGAGALRARTEGPCALTPNTS